MKAPTRVLLVDDDKDYQNIFTETISKIRNASLFAVAGNGEEALKYLENKDDLPDVILMDINMPVMDGIECLCEILSNPVLKNIPVVMLSSATDQVQIAKYLGAKAFIKKPHDYMVLREQLQKIVELDFTTQKHIADLSFQTEYIYF